MVISEDVSFRLFALRILQKLKNTIHEGKNRGLGQSTFPPPPRPYTNTTHLYMGGPITVLVLFHPESSPWFINKEICYRGHKVIISGKSTLWQVTRLIAPSVIPRPEPLAIPWHLLEICILGQEKRRIPLPRESETPGVGSCHPHSQEPSKDSAACLKLRTTAPEKIVKSILNSRF